MYHMTYAAMLVYIAANMYAAKICKGTRQRRKANKTHHQVECSSRTTAGTGTCGSTMPSPAPNGTTMAFVRRGAAADYVAPIGTRAERGPRLRGTRGARPGIPAAQAA
eukprot:CAMPEP_0170212274 /NCGR_PEP_ID=MMETSP0116_2-20130129/5754_1 /TAXON_ID=400756 /ORGANISM="Durinskia baltica, Strain CSIRO CS-38" /LENGTH=107 /DNA_ID=CAMNT_0010462811 /DNA_START=338 /DNA_END=658 /DNA_ORIENTATION=-